MIMPGFNLTEWYDVSTGRLRSDRPVVERRLSDVSECFFDQAACAELRKKEDQLLYAVTAVEDAAGEGDLHYGLGVLYPGKVGREYFMTKGHLHTWRPAAEVYVGLAGRGLMLLQDEGSASSCIEPLERNSIVYVPGYTAHRTINTGSEPLVYLGIYPSRAGHDYASIATKNFNMVVVERDGVPAMIERKHYGRPQ